MIELLNEIVGAGGYFCGGFVRDYLIRGESFQDIDFCFSGKWPHPFSSWKIIRSLKGRETAENIVAGMKYHCVNLEPIDLTCNLFCFDGSRIYARPCLQYRDRPINYVEAWEMLLEKKFRMQVPAIKNIKLRAKLMKRGWTNCGIDLTNNNMATPPECGPWSRFSIAKDRFRAVTEPSSGLPL